MMHLIDSAVGALKLYELQIQHPATVSTEQALAAGQEAMQRLNCIAREAMLLAEAFSAVRAVTPLHLAVMVAPGSQRNGGVIASIIDGQHILQTVYARTPEGLVEFLKLQREDTAA